MTGMLREGVLSQVGSWLAEADLGRVLVVVGSPGAGKSTLAAQILDRFACNSDGEDRLAARVLRPPVNPEPISAQAVIGQLAERARAVDADRFEQLLTVFTTGATIHSHIEIADGAVVGGDVNGPRVELSRPADLYNQVIAPILTGYKDGTELLVVIDALDEATADPTLATFLAAVADGQHPSRGIRWIVTTRPGHQVAPAEVINLDTGHGYDVTAWLEQELTSRNIDPARINAAIDVCDGNFLVAHHLTVDLDTNPNLDPGRWITSPGLTGVYQRHTHTLEQQLGAAAVGELLEVLTHIAAAGNDGATLDALARRTSLPARTITAATTATSAFLTVLPGDRYATYHPSYAEHLLAPTNNPEQVRRARDAHWNTAVDQTNGGLDHLTEEELTRLPGHLMASITLTPDGPDRTHQQHATLQLAWTLYHHQRWLDRANAILGHRYLTRHHLDLATLVLTHCRAHLDPNSGQLLIRYPDDELFVTTDSPALDPIPTVSSLRTRADLAGSLGRGGRHKEASSAWSQVEIERGHLLGPGHPDTLTARHAGATAVISAFFEDELTIETGRDWLPKLLVEVLEARSQSLGDTHRDTLQSRHALAAYMCRRRVGEGSDCAALEGVLRDQLRVLGPYDPDTLTTRHDLADLCTGPADPQAAVDALTGVAHDRDRFLGEDHPDTLATLHRLAFWLIQSGRRDDAARVLESVRRAERRTFADDHPRHHGTQLEIESLVDRHGPLGDDPSTWTVVWPTEKVDQLLEQVLHARLEVLGPDHLDTLAARRNVAAWLDKTGRRTAAMATYQQLLNDQVRVLGAHHPDAKATRDRLGLI